MASEKVEPGLVITGRYRVEKQLGEGGMGSVFLVQHVHTDEHLALKVLHAAVVKDAIALERFKREARTPARIGSDHVVRVTDADVSPELGGAPYLVMEYLRGQDLDKLVAERGALPPEDVVRYLQQAARALDKAHAMGIVHRDLKPENLFLTHREDGAPWIKVLDFGIAKLTEGSGVGTKTSTGQIFGTPLFMSPEQALAEHAKISPQTDVWALGLIAHKLLTGKDIWTAETLTHLLAQIAYQPLPVPSEHGATFGPQYDAWFARCCARDPAARFASAGEAAVELARALGLSMETTGRAGSAPSLATAAPVSGDVAIAKTVSPATPAPMGASAGPLTVGAQPSRRRTGVGVAVALALAGAGALLGVWIMRPAGAGPGDAPGPAAGPDGPEAPSAAARE
ncbi:MAG: protein kinase, partial [Polyangiaceae bacterium]|nr:protein kinase [Polyangiaceae bacterium]